MSDFNTLEVIRDPRGFATLWLSREDKNNAFNAQMIRELIVALDQLAEDAGLRFLVLRGRGRHFSAGADLAWMQQSAQLDFNTNLDDAHELGELMYALHRLKAPTLAVVQGAAWRCPGVDQLLRHGHWCRGCTTVPVGSADRPGTGGDQPLRGQGHWRASHPPLRLDRRAFQRRARSRAGFAGRGVPGQ